MLMVCLRATSSMVSVHEFLQITKSYGLKGQYNKPAPNGQCEGQAVTSPFQGENNGWCGLSTQGVPSSLKL